MKKGGRQAIRKGNWKAVKYDVFDASNSKLELYDLSNDIGEEHDIAAQHPEIISEMETILINARTPSEIFTYGQKTYLGKE